MRAEKWVAKNEFWVCCASSFVRLKCGCERKSSLWEREREERRERYKYTKEQNAHLLWTRLTRLRHELFMSFEFILQTCSVYVRKRRRLEKTFVAPKSTKWVFKKLSHKRKHTHTHQFLAYIPIYILLYILRVCIYVSTYVCMYVCIIMLGSLNKCCQRNLWSQFFSFSFF